MPIKNVDKISDKILNFTEKRKLNVEKKRRTYERIMFKNLMGIYSAIEGKEAISAIELIDISKDGCLIQIPWTPMSKEENAWQSGDDLKLRFYFTKDSYLPAITRVKRAQEYVEKGRSYLRYGLEFDKSVTTFEALKSFIDFLYKYAEFSSADKDESKVHFI